jgi:hypothetical protein
MCHSICVMLCVHARHFISSTPNRGWGEGTHTRHSVLLSLWLYVEKQYCCDVGLNLQYPSDLYVDLSDVGLNLQYPSDLYVDLREAVLLRCGIEPAVLLRPLC